MAIKDKAKKTLETILSIALEPKMLVMIVLLLGSVIGNGVFMVKNAYKNWMLQRSRATISKYIKSYESLSVKASAAQKTYEEFAKIADKEIAGKKEKLAELKKKASELKTGLKVEKVRIDKLDGKKLANELDKYYQ